jgi:acyl carrier protein phosphodiesterase
MPAMNRIKNPWERVVKLRRNPYMSIDFLRAGGIQDIPKENLFEHYRNIPWKQVSPDVLNAFIANTAEKEKTQAALERLQRLENGLWENQE